MSVNTGLIPAHAGKTAFFLGEFNGCWAHPRACGENFVEVGKDWADVGSSPRMRGKPLIPLSPLSHTGLIPAHAGKTHASCR